MSLPPDLATWFALYIGHFAAQSSDYVRQDVGGGKWTVHKPLTPEVVYESFTTGHFAVSGFMARWREVLVETHVGAIDFDTEAGLEQAHAVQSLLEGVHVGSMLVHSRRGAHLWVHADAVMPGATMRRALFNALTLIGLDDEKIEVFPKRSGSPFGCGALRMPLMKHPGTGVRYPVEGYHGDLLTQVQQVVFLAVDRTTPVGALYLLAGPEDVETRYPGWEAVYGARRPVSDDPSAVSVLASAGLPALPGRSVRCPLHDDRHASLSISADDERVWCKSPSCPLHNGGRGVGSRDLERLLSGRAVEGATHVPREHPAGP